MYCRGDTLSQPQTVARALAELRGGRPSTLLMTDVATGEEAILTLAPTWAPVRADEGAAAGLLWFIPVTTQLALTPQFATVFGLTRAEQRLLRLLMAEEELRDAAQQLHISIHTARNQLKSIFQKTGRRNQGQLLVLANRLASIQFQA